VKVSFKGIVPNHVTLSRSPERSEGAAKGLFEILRYRSE